MIEMFYYLAGVSVVGTIGFGLFYLYDETAAIAVMEEISWSAVRAYHRVNMETNNLRRYLEIELVESKNSDVEEDDESEEEEKLVNFLGFNKDGSVFTTHNLENNHYIEEENFDMMMLVKKQEELDLYKRIHEKGEINCEYNFETITKPFLSVEIEQNNNRVFAA